MKYLYKESPATEFRTESELLLNDRINMYSSSIPSNQFTKHQHPYRSMELLAAIPISKCGQYGLKRVVSGHEVGQ